MDGCCRLIEKKFITRAGVVDEARLKAAIDSTKNDDLTLIDEIEGCMCDCHRDGIVCMC